MYPRNYNDGINSVARNFAGDTAFEYKMQLITGQTTPTTGNSVFQILSYDEDNLIYNCVRPTVSDLPSAQLVFSSARLNGGEYATCGLDGPRWVAFQLEEGDDEPVNGEEVGCQIGSYKFHKNRTGFITLDYNSEEDLVLVRPFSSPASGVETRSYDISEDSTDTIAGQATVSFDWVTSSTTLDIDDGSDVHVWLDVNEISIKKESPIASSTIARLVVYLDIRDTDANEYEVELGQINGEWIWTSGSSSQNATLTGKFLSGEMSGGRAISDVGAGNTITIDATRMRIYNPVIGLTLTYKVDTGKAFLVNGFDLPT
jgi:hypothetical protein